MNNLSRLIADLTAKNAFNSTANLPSLQFGTQARVYVGATILPIQLVPDNKFTEYDVSYRTLLANSGTRYSPVTLDSNALVGSVEVSLGEMDAGDEFTASDYDNLLKLLNLNNNMQAVANVMQWSTRTLTLPILELMEKWRWEAIDDAVVTRIGHNKYVETVTYPNPTGHRVTIPSGTVAAKTGWHNPDSNPLEDISLAMQTLAAKGYVPNRIITSTKLLNLLSNHPKVRGALNGFSVGAGGTLVPAGQLVTRAQLNGYMQQNGWPAIEAYDLTANRRNLTTGAVEAVPFKRATAFTILATTGRDTGIQLATDNLRVVTNTLGYAAIGRAAGQSGPGIVTLVEPKNDKPPRLEGQSWATGAPVILDPEAIFVITCPDPTP